jgi:TolB-like protein
VRSLRIALALLLIAPLAVRAQAVNIAIFPLSGFLVEGGDGSALASSFRDMLITEFASNARLKMIDRASVDELLKSQQMSLSGKLKDEEVQRVGQLLGAQYAVAGGIAFDKTTARIDLRVVDIETGLITHPFKKSVSRDKYLSAVDQVSAEYADLKLKPRAVEVVVPVPSAFAYSRGLDYEKRGDKTKAAEMYQAAIRIFPENAAAKAALGRVK